MPNQNKIDQVKILKDKLSRAKALFLADYRGLTHQQLESLRKNLKKAKGEFVIAKNTLIKIAIKENKSVAESDTEQFDNELKNPTAALFAFGDEVAPIRVLSDFIKNNQLPKIKIGLFGGKVAKEADFKKLAALPTRDVLLATLAMRMKSPIYGLHYALRWNLQGLVTTLGNIKEKKNNVNPA